MDPTVPIPIMSNLSLAVDNATAATADIYARSCTALNDMKLSDVFTQMDIGDNEFWGDVNMVWMGFFITHCVLFYATLLALICTCFCLLFHVETQEYAYSLRTLCSLRILYSLRTLFLLRTLYSLRTLMYILFNYIFWFISVSAHGILIIYSIADDSESTDRPLAAVIRSLETAASSFFVGIIVLSLFLILIMTLRRLILRILLILKILLIPRISLIQRRPRQNIFTFH